MPRNKVQFQKGYSLSRFLATYGSEDQCQHKLFQARWPKGYECPRCGHNRSYLLKSRQLYQWGGNRQEIGVRPRFSDQQLMF